ncbi:hypothetical protein [Microbacterium sp.]|jgi:hypothetical protein|uniref:hypothetical protein n=1 Tax=Microbacterium sp. TaxID=51671 RepID=UPI002FDFA3E1
MNRRLAALTIAAVAVLGLTACSGSPSASEETSSSNETAAPTAESSDQSVADACASASAQVQDATKDLTSIDMTTAAADPQGTIDTFTQSVDAIGAAAESISNPEVKAAVTDVYEDFGAMRDVLSKVLIDQDMDAAAEMTQVSADVQESATAIGTLCAG